ncbi:MAG: dTDP-4-amino-4,6-dideoxygalactose transaminase [Gammaproteobacteria bacterium]
MNIPFNKPHLTGEEFKFMREAHLIGQLAGDGYFTKKCSKWLEEKFNTPKALLTHSCTAALEMAAILAEIKRDDEIIMPSYTFVSTANAFVLRGGIPVFVDIRADTLNIDERLIEGAITPKTKAIVVVHYAGVACEMDEIMRIARKHNLLVIEDAAQAILASYKGRALGSIGDFGCLSFHETKNIISGEGGALLINNKNYISRAEMIREKGTNRSEFYRGMSDKYTWRDIGSSFLPGELTAAFLWAQFLRAEEITEKRLRLWDYYEDSFQKLFNEKLVHGPSKSKYGKDNGHIYYLMLNNIEQRTQFISSLKAQGINCPFHYIPLHSSIGGIKFARIFGQMTVTESAADRIVRLPLWIDMEPEMQKAIIRDVRLFFGQG